MHYQVHEFFSTIQGEGVHAGETALFVRLQGCPIQCDFCDAKRTWFAGGQRMTMDDLTEATRGWRTPRWCVITGGEPLIYDLDPLIDWAHKNEMRSQIETSGALPFKGDRRPRWLTVSPKHPVNFEVEVGVLKRANELKYVVDDRFDPEIARTHLDVWSSLNLPSYAPAAPEVVLMPEGSPPKPENVARALAILAREPSWRFGPRLQYAYPEIAAMEGDTNDIISVDQAREESRAHARGE